MKEKKLKFIETSILPTDLGEFTVHADYCVEAVLEKRATHLVRRDSENIVCLRGGVTNSRKLATVGENAVQRDVQVAVAVTITPLTGSTDSAAKPVTILRL